MAPTRSRSNDTIANLGFESNLLAAADTVHRNSQLAAMSGRARLCVAARARRRVRTVVALFIPLIAGATGTSVAGEPRRDALADVIDYLKPTCVSIEVCSDSSLSYGQSIGSGFLVLSRGNVYGVTNAHVMRAYPSLRKAVGLTDEDGLKVLVGATPIGADEAADLVVLQLVPSKNVDVQRVIGRSMIGNSAMLREGIEAVWLGHPLHIGVDQTRNYPVIRRGIIAYVAPDRSWFYLDGSVNRGSSGSPVFDARTGKLLGLVTGFQPENATDDMKMPLLDVLTNAGLAHCIAAERVLPLIP